ncbi:NADPH-dependent FMN reductase [Lysobacter hankyongensis]|uniref:NADPH-dependent FMN reductase n=1 Tax=Lysobacter hankyongensis TaxID=1176535 RepID=A0ABP9BZR6_9GAMM
MTRILGISGSLRAASFNTALLRAARRAAPEGVEIEIATLHGIPLYDGDLEAATGIPEAVDALKARIRASDALLLATPEYNNGMPGVLKNAIDWLSRPAGELRQLFGGRPLALMGASPSGFGTLLAQAAWLPVLKSLGVQVWPGKSLMLSRAHQSIGADGEIVDEAALKTIADFVAGYAASLEGR